MSIGAPEPESFQGMMDTFAVMAPAAAVEIVLPAFTFGPSCTQIARIIYMNQCNPGQIMMVGAYWFQLAEKYITAAQALQDEIDAMDAESWDGDDCQAFIDQSGKVQAQLWTIATFAIEVGIGLFSIAALLAVMVTAYTALATILMAMALVYWPLQAFPPTAAAAQAVRAAAMTVAATGLGILKALDTALTVLGKGLAAGIGAGMGLSWTVLATQGNVVNPLDLVGPTAFNMAQGLAQLGLRNALAPSGGKHVAPGFAHLFMGGQGAYNSGLNANDLAQDGNVDGKNDPRAETGLDPGNLDFIPTIEAPEWADDDAPDWG
ncbi:hypothetical protein O1R50_11625 [Glycomyces luteolus]|uniref:Uncharacterized protein n=1 Tax=Glycomyces luteolus TaxID=2670330 RepID=A0A9X3P8H2_9ACTN|nr:hypothetical protein [Glycomyces luteolus]MDA1360277.1 hypothetical protein [Glycomyces luteolus]